MSEDFKEVQDMLEQAKELVKTLENKYNELSKPKNVRWRAEKVIPYTKDSFYYYINIFGEICNCPDGKNKQELLSDFLYQTGNYFKTSEEAEKYKNNLIITQKLKDIALRLNNGVENIYWESDIKTEICGKYYIILNHCENKLKQCVTYIAQGQGTIFCLCKYFLETAIKEIGEKELIEYIKGC